MAWNKEKEQTGISYARNTSGDPILEWHERAPEREYIYGKTFEQTSSNTIIAFRNKSDQVTRYRCPGSVGFKTHADFLEQELCRNCQYRTEDFHYPDVSHDLFGYVDLAGFFDPRRSHFSTVVVPNGCPCADSHYNSWNYSNRLPARQIALSRHAALIPKAWKITWDGYRLRLSFHFRRLYVSPNLKMANDGFFQHVVVDIDSGKTFVTDISDGTRHHVKKGTRPVEDITYTGHSDFLTEKLSESDLQEPLWYLRAELVRKLSERNITVTASPTDEPVTISDIALMNRYPASSSNPFPHRWLWPDRLQRRISSIPRNADIPEILTHLKIPYDMQLAGQLMKHPAAIEPIWILHELGCNELSAYKIASETDHNAENINYFMRMFCMYCNERDFCGVDVLTLLIPRITIEQGSFWDSIVAEMVEIGSEANRRNGEWFSGFAENAVVHARHLSFPVSTYLRGMVSVLSTPNFTSKIPNMIIDAKLSDAFQSSNDKWKIYPTSDAEMQVSDANHKYIPFYLSNILKEFKSGRKTFVTLHNTTSNKKFIVTLKRQMSIDRRKWKGAIPEKYANAADWDKDICFDILASSYTIDDVGCYNEETFIEGLISTSDENISKVQKAVKKWAKRHFVKLRT